MNQYYKYRSVGNFEYLADNLINQRFYCFPWSKLNDPMEGIFCANIKDKGHCSLQWGSEDSPRICSFSTDMSEIRMWAHYAQNHKGVAIEFSTSKSLKKVRYNKSPPEFCEGVSKTNIMSNKLYQWKYENEWRYITFDPIETFLEGKITKVIFGIRTPDAIKEVIESICKSKGIATADTHLDTTECKIVEN